MFRAFAPSPYWRQPHQPLCAATAGCPALPFRPHLRPRTGMQIRNQIDQTSLPLTHNFTPKLHLGLQPGPMILARSCRFVAHNNDFHEPQNSGRGSCLRASSRLAPPLMVSWTGSFAPTGCPLHCGVGRHVIGAVGKRRNENGKLPSPPQLSMWPRPSRCRRSGSQAISAQPQRAGKPAATRYPIQHSVPVGGETCACPPPVSLPAKNS